MKMLLKEIKEQLKKDQNSNQKLKNICKLI